MFLNQMRIVKNNGRLKIPVIWSRGARVSAAFKSMDKTTWQQVRNKGLFTSLELDTRLLLESMRKFSYVYFILMYLFLYKAKHYFTKVTSRRRKK